MMTDPNNSFTSSISLHETIAFGDYEHALSTPNTDTTETGKKNEMLRLPLLLRLLSSSQHLATLNAITDTDEDDEISKGAVVGVDSETNSSTRTDYVTTVVQLLEQVAARHACAENIEVFSHLAPEICRPIAKSLSRPLKRKRRLITVGSHDEKEVVLGKGVVVTDRIETGGQSIATSGWYDDSLKEICGKSKHYDDDKGKGGGDGEDMDLIKGAGDGDDYQSQEEGGESNDEGNDSSKTSRRENSQAKETKRGRKGGVNIIDRASLDESDTLESTVCKTLLELLNLVASSLKPIQASTRLLTSTNSNSNSNINSNSNSNSNSSQKQVSEKDADDEDNDADKDEASGQLNMDSVAEIKLKPDSLLSETSLGSIYDSELSAIITSLMHYTPIIRHEHLANALCRACVPQCADIVKRLAANCSIASAALVRGCIDACRIAEMCNDGEQKDGNIQIIQRAKESVESIATLSTREAAHVAGVLRQSCIMPDVLIRVAMTHNADSAVPLIWSVFRESSGETQQTRVIGRVSRLRVRNKDNLFAAFRPQESMSSKVLEALRGDSDLAASTRSFLVLYLAQLHNKGKIVVWGQVVMCVQSLGMLVQGCGVGPLDEIENCNKILVEMLKSINCAERESRETSKYDEFVKSAIATLTIICSKYMSLSGANENAFKSVYFPSFHDWVVSRASAAFVERIQQLINGCEVKCLQNALLCALFSEKQAIDSTNDEDTEITKFCEWASHLCTDAKRDDSFAGVMGLIEMGVSTSVSYEVYSAALDKVLDDPIKCSELYHDKNVLVLIDTAISKLMRKDPPYIPAVLPLSIDFQCRKVLKYMKCNDDNLWRQFLIHLVYACSFLSKFPKTSFGIIPSSLPLKEIVARICQGETSLVGKAIIKFVKQFCPEILQQGIDRLPRVQDGVELEFDIELIKPASVARAVQDIISSHDSQSSNISIDLERRYIASRATFPSIEVDVEVASALLRSVEDSYHFMSYSILSKDPLVLLKCSLGVWTNDTLRRILLCIFNRVLASHDALVADAASDPEVSSECLASRDILLVRCFLFLLSGCYNEKKDSTDCAINCPIMLSMVRHAVAKHRGLAASLVRQGLPFNALDWFVQNVPETFADAIELTTMLESRTLTVMEKLQISDGALCMSILHGLNDSTSQRLVYNALSVLVSSFYLVVGPVGVPVNVLCDEHGRDITQTCRVVMFRMLGILRNIGSENKSLRHEATLSLSKIANLCKSDGAIGGLKGEALKKRKKLLTEVWDAIVKANEAFGGGVQL